MLKIFSVHLKHACKLVQRNPVLNKLSSWYRNTLWKLLLFLFWFWFSFSRNDD